MKHLAKILFIGLVFFSSQASAYVPPPSFTLGKIATMRERVKTITMTRFVGIIRDDQEDLGALQETLTLDLKSETISSTAGWKADALLNLPGWALLTAVTPEDMAGAMKGLGIDYKVATKHLKRWDGRMCWVYRSPSGQTEVWIEKDAFMPLRVRQGLVGNVAATDVQYTQHKVFGEGYAFPQEILYVKSGQPRLRFKLTDLSVNKPLTTPAAAFLMTEKSQEVLQEMSGVFR